MSHPRATPGLRTQRAQTARRGSPGGLLLVGDYVGQAAGVAAKAVRRAGLRPGLDRSFGCAPDVVGQVVAQEPPAGSDLGRNGLVTLYVAAPSVTQGEEDTDDRYTEGEEPRGTAASLAATAQEAPHQVRPRTRRPRKPGRATRPPHVFETPPPPVPLARQPSSEAQAQDAEADRTEEWDYGSPAQASAPSDGEEPRVEVAGEQAGDGLTHQELVVDADDLFAGRASAGLPAWRRVYPRPAGRGFRARLARHPWLVGTAGLMLAVWAVVGVIAALVGQPASVHHANVLSGAAGRAGAPAIHAAEASPQRHTAVHPAKGSSLVDTARRRRAALRHSPEPAPAREAAARPDRGAAQPSPPPQPAPPASPTPASAPPPPAQEQTQGGLFSP